MINLYQRTDLKDLCELKERKKVTINYFKSFYQIGEVT